MARKATRARRPKIAVGNFVLCGGTPASYPSDWYLGEVLWVGDDDVLIGRSTLHGDRWREVVSLLHVRAVGTIAELVSIQRQATDEVRDLCRAIRDAEQTLGAARDALWNRLAEMAEGGLMAIPPDFDAIERQRLRLRDAVGRADEEALALRLSESANG